MTKLGHVVYGPLDLSVTNDSDQDIWELTTGAAEKVQLLGWELTSQETTAESVDLRLTRSTNAGSGGSAVTVAASYEPGTTITSALDSLNTTPGATGLVVLQQWTWEQLGKIGQVYTPEMGIIVQSGEYLKLNLETAVASTRQWRGWVCWQEI